MTGEAAALLTFRRDLQFYRFSAYGFLKNLRFFEPFIILYFREAGFSFLEIGMLFAIRELSTLVLEVPTGFVADLRGRKLSMVFSMCSYIVSFAILFFNPGIKAAALAMAVFGLGEAFRTGTHKAMILEYLKRTGQSEWKVDYYGATRAASQLGSAVNALLAAALVFFTGSFRYIFPAAALPCILNLINLATYPSWLNGTNDPTVRERPGFMDVFRLFTSIFRLPHARRAIVNSAVFDGLFKVIKEYLQPILQALALGLPVLLAMEVDSRTAIVVGLVYFLIYLGASVASRMSGRFSRRTSGIVSASNITWIVGSGLIVGAGLMAELGLFAGAAGLFLLLFSLQNLRRPMCVAYISETVPARVMASGLSVESLVKMLVMTLLAPICGLAADNLGIGPTVAIVGALMTLLYIPLKLCAVSSNNQAAE